MFTYGKSVESVLYTVYCKFALHHHRSSNRHYLPAFNVVEIAGCIYKPFLWFNCSQAIVLGRLLCYSNFGSNAKIMVLQRGVLLLLYPVQGFTTRQTRLLLVIQSVNIQYLCRLKIRPPHLPVSQEHHTYNLILWERLVGTVT